MPKLYTKKGDGGSSSLFDGSRRSKSDDIFDLLGDIDELNCVIGVLLVYIPSVVNTDAKKIENKLRMIQVRLMHISSVIASCNRTEYKLQYTNPTHISTIETWIDECEKNNSTLTRFILPGVDIADAECNRCRAISRRVERKYVQHLNRCRGWVDWWKGRGVSDNNLKYLNRLSDFFFALSRNLSCDREKALNDFSD